MGPDKGKIVVAIWTGYRWRAICKVKGCETFVQPGKKLCGKHGAHGECKVKGCTQNARSGKKQLCVKHGAHGECKVKGCTQNARSGKKQLCVKHGAHGECKVKGCTQNALSGKIQLCGKHGAYGECKVKGCTQNALSGKIQLCAKHGAHGECKVKGCTQNALSSKIQLCGKHGGGTRCSYLDVHQFEKFPPVSHTKVDGRHICFDCFQSKYPHMCKDWQCRREHFILAEIQRRLPELWDYFVTWDCPIPGGCSLKKPDMLWDMKLWYFHVEVDEDGNNHEDCRERLREIQRDMGGKPGLVLRVNIGKHPMMTRKKRYEQGGNVQYIWKKSEHFDECMDEIVEVIDEYVGEYIPGFNQNPHAYSGNPNVVKIFFD